MPKPSVKTMKPGGTHTRSECTRCGWVVTGDKQAVAARMNFHVRIQHQIDNPTRRTTKLESSPGQNLEKLMKQIYSTSCTGV